MMQLYYNRLNSFCQAFNCIIIVKIDMIDFDYVDLKLMWMERFVRQFVSQMKNPPFCVYAKGGFGVHCMV